MLELILGASAILLLMVTGEVLGTILLKRVIKKAEDAVAGKKLQFHLSTLLVLTLCTAGALYGSISLKNGSATYVGWPLPARTLFEFPTRDKMPAREHTNWLNIVVNVLGILVSLVLIGVALEGVHRR